MMRLLSALMLAVVSLVSPSGGSAQIGCAVERTGGLSDFAGAGMSAHFSWVTPLEDPCDWGGDYTHDPIHITTPLGKGRCYDAELSITYENRMSDRSLIITSYVDREALGVRGGWANDGMVRVVVAPRGQPGSIVPVTVRSRYPFEGAADDNTRVKGYFLLGGVRSSGSMDFSVDHRQFRVWEVDCGSRRIYEGP